MTDPTIAELADQVRAGLAVDQEYAEWASSGPWWTEGGAPVHWGDEPDSEVVGPKGTVAMLGHDRNGALNSAHIARHDPARVLADVAAKRALLDEVLGWLHDDLPMRCPALRGNPGPCDCGRDERVRTVLQHLAQTYRTAKAQEGP